MVFCYLLELWTPGVGKLSVAIAGAKEKLSREIRVRLQLR